MRRLLLALALPALLAGCGMNAESVLILVVDDEASILEMLHDVLEAAGYAML